MTPILLNIVEIFFLEYDANKNISKNWNDCIIFCYKKNLGISLQNRPEHETTSLNAKRLEQLILNFLHKVMG